MKDRNRDSIALGIVGFAVGFVFMVAVAPQSASALTKTMFAGIMGIVMAAAFAYIPRI